ncbi:MAG: tyrosine-type recombinase/integrase, partial [Candidatus Sulfotelmatobacter sp.]
RPLIKNWGYSHILPFWLPFQVGNITQVTHCKAVARRRKVATPSLFRHHRLVSKVPQANPHRFRHSFGSDMVRAGISLPALMHLMGHADIQTTMLYVQLAPEDVWREFARAVQQRVRMSPPEKMS